MQPAHLLTINGVTRDVYDDAGQGPTILFLHGNSSQWQHWAPQLRSFAGRYRCVAFDQRGFGTAEAPEGTSLTAMADDAAALCAALGIGTVFAVGLSMGGAVAQVLALRHPALSTAFAAAPPSLPVAPGGPVPTREQLRGALELSFSAAFRQEEPALVGRLLDECLETDLATLGRFAVEDVADFDPAQVTTPALVIAGSADILAPAAGLRILALSLPHAEYLEIAGSGHWLNIEQPEVFDAAVTAFFDRHPHR